MMTKRCNHETKVRLRQMETYFLYINHFPTKMKISRIMFIQFTSVQFVNIHTSIAFSHSRNLIVVGDRVGAYWSAHSMIDLTNASICSGVFSTCIITRTRSFAMGTTGYRTPCVYIPRSRSHFSRLRQ